MLNSLTVMSSPVICRCHWAIDQLHHNHYVPRHEMTMSVFLPTEELRAWKRNSANVKIFDFSGARDRKSNALTKNSPTSINDTMINFLASKNIFACYFSVRTIERYLRNALVFSLYTAYPAKLQYAFHFQRNLGGWLAVQLIRFINTSRTVYIFHSS